MMTSVQGLFKEHGKHRLLYAAVFFCFFALYAATAQRGVSWQDSGEFQYRVLAGDYQWHSGIARAHPLYIALARGFAALFPKAACFYAVNLFSGLGLALALALLAANVVRLTRSVPAAVMAVGVLGFAHMAWWLGTVAEVYTWSLAFLMAEVLCLIRFSEGNDGRWLIVLFGVNGLHVSLHNAALLGLPVYVFVLVSALRQKEKRVWVAGGSAMAWLVGASLVGWQAASLLKGTGDPALVMKSVLFGDGYERQVLGTGGFALKRWAVNMALAGVSMINPCWVFAGRGLFPREEGAQEKVRNRLRVLTVLHGLFWVRYFVPDQATFVVPTLGLLAVWVGLGYAKLAAGCRKPGGRFLALLAAGVASAVAGPWLLCEAAQRTGMMEARSRSLPFRQEAGYWLKPWKQTEISAAAFVEETGRTLLAGDLLLADATAAGPLLAAREAGVLSRAWRLITPWSGETDAEILACVREGVVTVYVVSPVAGYVPQGILNAGCSFERKGAVYRVTGSRQ